MKQKIHKAMILGAGLGTRLSPITEKIPKPLVPVLNVSNVLHTLHLLKKSGIREIVINVHHLPHLIEEYLQDGKKWNVEIHYSREKTLLGTGGGVKRAEAFLGTDSFILANCDFITNADLGPLITHHQSHGATATMGLLDDSLLVEKYSKVGVDASGILCCLPKCQTGTPHRIGMFTGIHVLESKIFPLLQESPSGINDTLYPALMRSLPHETRGYFLQNCYWYDTGELTEFLKTSLQLLRHLGDGDPVLKALMHDFGDYSEIKPSVWLPRGEKAPQDVQINGPVILGRDCEIPAGSGIGPFVVLGDGCRLTRKAHLSRLIAFDKAQIAEPNTDVSGLFYRQSILSRF